MTDKHANEELKEYADGWITERKGTDVPAFLKAAFVVIALSALIYFFVYMNGETTHSDRGVLVESINRVTQHSDPFMYIVAGLAVVFTVILIVFAFKRFHD